MKLLERLWKVKEKFVRLCVRHMLQRTVQQVDFEGFEVLDFERDDDGYTFLCWRGFFTRRKDEESSFIGNTGQNFFTKLRYNLLLKYANVTSHTWRTFVRATFEGWNFGEASAAKTPLLSLETVNMCVNYCYKFPSRILI